MVTTVHRRTGQEQVGNKDNQWNNMRETTWGHRPLGNGMQMKQGQERGEMVAMKKKVSLVLVEVWK
jgi:hypothetical protein